ncbi:hypothetical protein ACIBG8_50930 [Nonomuraea sp. NPDC050556]|uniref:hypothetical protein n=1 Tax=Nonomuraea sp. NPDC050556 TaxID=3364369 RepID=UPI00378B2283
MSEDEPYGVHVAEASAEHTHINWEPARPRVNLVRVRAHTCDCQPVFYELCQAAGLMFIRKVSRRGGKTVVHESAWQRTEVACALWLQLLRGKAL